MHWLRFGKSIVVLFIFVCFFSLFLVPAAMAGEEVKKPACAAPFEVGAEGRKLLERGSVDPTPEVIPLFYLPRDDCGFVDWAEALRQGVLAPRDSIEEKYSLIKSIKFPNDIILRVESPGVANVIFPHDIHMDVLDCKICHPGIFQKEIGKTGISMAGIREGEYCGRCHGKVSFPLSNCSRCHSGSIEIPINR